MQLLSDRLLLRPPAATDADDALALLRGPEVVYWHPAPAVLDHESAVAWCRRGAAWSDDHVTLHGVDPATGRLILNLSLALDAEHSVAKVGYRVVPWQRGHGYACEGLLAVTEWAFSELGLARIQLEHSVTNVASCRVASAAGYRMEGHCGQRFEPRTTCATTITSTVASRLNPALDPGSQPPRSAVRTRYPPDGAIKTNHASKRGPARWGDDLGRVSVLEWG